MLEKYLFTSSVYIATIEADIVGVFVLFPIDKTLIEIKNIAVAERHQGKREFEICEKAKENLSEIMLDTPQYFTIIRASVRCQFSTPKGKFVCPLF